MIYDRQTTFSFKQAVTAAGTVNSTDVYDTGVSGININTNRELQLFAEVEEAFVGGTSVQLQFVESDTPDLAAATVLATSPVIATANLTVGRRFFETALPKVSKRYLGFKVVSLGVFTAGNFSGGIVRDIQGTVVPDQNTGYI